MENFSGEYNGRVASVMFKVIYISFCRNRAYVSFLPYLNDMPYGVVGLYATFRPSLSVTFVIWPPFNYREGAMCKMSKNIT